MKEHRIPLIDDNPVYETRDEILNSRSCVVTQQRKRDNVMRWSESKSKQSESFRSLRGALIIGVSVILVGWVPQSGCAQQFSKEQSTTRDGDKDYRLASGHSALRIPFEEDDGHIFLKVRINDSKPVWFGLDTGATHSLIDLRYAESLRLKSESSQPIGGAGGYEEASIFKNVSIKLPGADLYNQTLWGLGLDAIASANGREMAGILGYDLFKRFVVDIDYGANADEPARATRL